MRQHLTILALIALIFFSCTNMGPDIPDDDDVEVIENPDPLSLWNESPTKSAIIEFVEGVTDQGSDMFVAVEDRIAVFDNDGTLWCEQPLYIQMAFGLERALELSKNDPSLASREPFKSLVAGDLAGAFKGGEKAMLEMMMVSHGNMTTFEFEYVVAKWLSSAKHPRFDVAYDQLTYSPMVELLLYLRENDFQTFIVSGGGVDFIRSFSMDAYGIPPPQVVGSSIQVEYRDNDPDAPVLFRLPELFFIDDGPGKPVGIHYNIGQRPIAAFGNSDGDYEMLEWVTSGPGPSFGAFVHHTDSIREYAYDREGHIGVLNRGLDDAGSKGWHLIDMKNDWKEIF